MFGFFKKKDKNDEAAGQIIEWGGVAPKRKQSASEAAKEEADQRAVDQRNKERRDMYCHPGVERVFNDVDGRHIALRTEDNTESDPNPNHPPVNFTAYWGARMIGCAKGELINSHLRLYHYETVNGYEARGIGPEILKEAENYARSKGLKGVSAPIIAVPNANEWDETLFIQYGFLREGEEFFKKI